MTLSVCLIVKDEEAVLARCLNCVRPFADEIVIVDTGSADATAEIARQFTDKVYFYDWCDDFAAARNFSFSKAEKDLVMWLDADDVITSENAEKILRIKDEMKDYDMAFLPYAAAFDGEEPTLVYFRERIFRRSLGVKWRGAVHEAIEPFGRILYSDACIYHKKLKSGNSCRNLRIYQKLISGGNTLSSRDKFYYGRELMFNKMYCESVAVLENFISGEGWAENKAEACLDLYYVYSALGNKSKAEGALVRSFTFAPPKSQVCCILGEIFFERGELEAAKYWYSTAATLPQNIRSGAFVNRDYCGYIPFMQLCVIYDKLGDYEKAREYNELAGSVKPNSKSYLYNKRYFEGRLLP